MTTAFGKATSSQDFFIPPSPYTGADVEVTDRMNVGDSKTVTINTANKIALILFDGTAGQRVSFRMTSVTYPSCGSAVYIRNPNGTILGSDTCISSLGDFIDTKVLPVTGTYTIQVDPAGTNTGSMTLTLYNVPADVSGTITPGGASVPVTTTVPGQNAVLTFSGTAGQFINLGMSSVTFGTCASEVYIRNPDGTTLASDTCISSSGDELDTQLLFSGTHSILLDPSGINTGSVTFTLSQPITGSITINGSSVPVSITRPGQDARLTFSGTASQQVTVRLTSNTIGLVIVSLLKPDGTSLTSSTSSASSFNLTTQTLPTTDTYTVRVDPAAANTGSITISVTSP